MIEVYIIIMMNYSKNDKNGVFNSETHLVECKQDITMFGLLVGDQTAPHNHTATISRTP